VATLATDLASALRRMELSWPVTEKQLRAARVEAELATAMPDV
jgi:hypothetical protein